MKWNRCTVATFTVYDKIYSCEVAHTPIRPVDLLSTTCALLDGNGFPRPSQGRLTRRELGDLLDEALAIGSDLFTVDDTTSEGRASN
jgi:hypothetical protein